jgi:hypothetical protein
LTPSADAIQYTQKAIHSAPMMVSITHQQAAGRL